MIIEPNPRSKDFPLGANNFEGLLKNLFCIQMRSSAEIWVEKERAQKLQTLLEGISTHRFVLFEDETVNTADIVGIFSAETMLEVAHRKNGEWKCEHGRWYGKFEKCQCGIGVDMYKNFSKQPYV